MKIYSINTINLKIDKKDNSLLKKSTTPSIDTSIKTLIGIPKSYISFGADKRWAEEAKRKEAIAEYLKYKDLAQYYDQGENAYKMAAEQRIKELQEANSYNGFWTGAKKLGKVNKVKRLQIEKDEFKNFVKEKELCKKILANEAYYKSLMSTDDIEIYEYVKELLTKKTNGLDCKIAGYTKQKQEIKKILIEPIQRETALNTKEKISPAVLIYGATGCGKSEMAKAIGEEAGCNVVLFPSTSPRKFSGELKYLLEEAKNHYLFQNQINNEERNNYGYEKLSNKDKAEFLISQKSPRTIIVIDEVDKYFDPSVSHSSEEIADNNKTILKGVLDHCSEKPNSEYSSDAAGVTFIFTTNYPTKVDSEISLRNGKCSKMSVSVPNENDIKDIMKLYLSKENSRISKSKSEGKSVDEIDISQIPFDSYVEIAKPDGKKGAITGAGLEKAIENAVTNYIENPNAYVNVQLPKMLSGAQYRIRPEKLNEYKKEIEAMGRMHKDIDEKEELELLKEAKELDMLKGNQLERLEYLQGVIEYTEM